jgi:hypothetical protein
MVGAESVFGRNGNDVCGKHDHIINGTENRGPMEQAMALFHRHGVRSLGDLI